MFANIVRSWNEMSLYRKVRRIFMIGLFVFGLWALTPYLYNRQVNEEFPTTAQEATTQARSASNSASTAVADSKVPAAPATAMSEQAAGGAKVSVAPTVMPVAPAVASSAAPAAPVGPVALQVGNFTPGSTPGDTASGKAVIYRIADGTQILRLEDFKTTNGPDLFVVLSGGANPDHDGVKAGAFLQLASLKGNQGNQNYTLPANIDLGQYKSAVIWCRTFNVVFAYAPLQPAS